MPRLLLADTQLHAWCCHSLSAYPGSPVGLFCVVEDTPTHALDRAYTSNIRRYVGIGMGMGMGKCSVWRGWLLSWYPMRSCDLCRFFSLGSRSVCVLSAWLLYGVFCCCVSRDISTKKLKFPLVTVTVTTTRCLPFLPLRAGAAQIFLARTRCKGWDKGTQPLLGTD